MIPATLQRRLLEFAVIACELVDQLPRTQLGIHICKQLILSSTSPVPNYAEACAAESRNDFIHKLSVCLKKLRESKAWIELIVEAKLTRSEKLKSVHDESDQRCKIIAQSILTTKKNRLDSKKRG